MAKKIIRLTEGDLKNMVKESLAAVLNRTQQEMAYEEPLVVEMARINKKEGGNSIFPYNSFVVRIWSNDHEPPHFHVEKDGWNIAFTIDDGELYKVEGQGKNQQVRDYIISNVKKWLMSKSANRPRETNQENAMATWEELHD